MKKFAYLMFGLLLCSILLSGCSDCGSNKDRNNNIVSGTMLFNDFEGGFYGIKADDGDLYDPMDLPAEYEEDELRVWFKVKLTDLYSTHMWGVVVEVLEIRKL